MTLVAKKKAFDSTLTVEVAKHSKTGEPNMIVRGRGDLLDIFIREAKLAYKKHIVGMNGDRRGFVISFKGKTLDEVEAIANSLKASIVPDSQKFDKAFLRVPKKVIGNELYSVTKEVDNLYKSLSNGNDLDIATLDRIISKLEKVKSSAVRFNTKEDIPSDFDSLEVHDGPFDKPDKVDNGVYSSLMQQDINNIIKSISSFGGSGFPNPSWGLRGFKKAFVLKVLAKAEKKVPASESSGIRNTIERVEALKDSTVGSLVAKKKVATSDKKDVFQLSDAKIYHAKMTGLVGVDKGSSGAELAQENIEGLEDIVAGKKTLYKNNPKVDPQIIIKKTSKGVSISVEFTGQENSIDRFELTEEEAKEVVGFGKKVRVASERDFMDSYQIAWRFDSDKDEHTVYELKMEGGKFNEKEVFTGTLAQINAWARKQGLKFKKDGSLFGGYFTAPDGTAYSLRAELDSSRLLDARGSSLDFLFTEDIIEEMADRLYQFFRSGNKRNLAKLLKEVEIDDKDWAISDLEALRKELKATNVEGLNNVLRSVIRQY